jgi:hypothetical protein
MTYGLQVRTSQWSIYTSILCASIHFAQIIIKFTINSDTSKLTHLPVEHVWSGLEPKISGNTL